MKIQADINRSGAVVDSRVTRSSGFASLDNAALDAVKNTGFLPALKNGRTVEASIIIPIGSGSRTDSRPRCSTPVPE